jgi:flagellar assembly protein FliH
MISPSEEAGLNHSAGLSVDLLRDAWREGSVFPLEFEALDRPLRHKAGSLEDYEGDSHALLLRAREEMEALEMRFQLQTQQLPVQVAEARREGALEARLEWKTELEERIAKERALIALACNEFAKERRNYFAAVEGEVIRLALAIATRVLHREAKLDPLLLAGVVRVALDKVAEESGAVLHVPEAQAEAWRTMLSAEGRSMVKVAGEEGMEATECRLATSIGHVELGVAVQLEEIEKGFFDLLQQRPM